MRETQEKLEQFVIDVILDRRQGTRAFLMRGFLVCVSKVYEVAVSIRLSLYRNRILRERSLGCLVVSIGNLTLGGTGKTPVVEKFARSLQDGGRRVAILSRGYKSVKQPFLKRLLGKIQGNEPPPTPGLRREGSRTPSDPGPSAGREPRG